MKSLGQIRSELVEGQFDFSHHAFSRAVSRNIGEHEIREAGTYAIVVEEYTEDKYGPSCLVLGFTRQGRPLHIHLTVADTPQLRIITIYEPDGNEWENYMRRR